MKVDLLKSVGVLMASVLVGGLPSVASADDLQAAAPFPTQATTADKRVLLGGWLEDRFQKMVASCTSSPVGAIQLKARSRLPGAKSGPVSVVPIQVQNFYGLTRSANSAESAARITGVYNLGSQSLNSLFSLVETSDTPKTVISGELMPGVSGIASLSLSMLPPDLNEPLAQFNGAGYSMSCANAFSFAYKFDAGYKVLPAGAIGAALDGGASSSSNNNLRLSAGVFYSPFVAMWRGQFPTFNAASLAPTGTQTYRPDESSALKVLAGSLFWQWYLDHPEKADKKNYILEYFSGVATVEEQTASSGDRIRAQVSADLTVPVVSAGIRAELDSRKETSFWSRTFDLAAYRDGRSKHAGSAYYGLPSPATIAEELKAISLKSPSTEPIVLNPAGTTDLYQDAYGLVQPACSWGWVLQAGNGKPAGLELTSVGPDRDASGIPVCRFRLSYTPSESAKRDGAQIDFNVVGNRQVGNVAFALKGAPVRVRPLAVGRWKRLSVGSQTPVDETGQPLSATSKKAIWKFDFQFDPGESGMATPTYWTLFDRRPDICDGGRDPVTNITPKLSATEDVNLGYVLTVTFEAGIPAGTTLSAPPNASECRFSAKLRFGPPGAQPVTDPHAFSSLPLVYPLLAKSP